MTTEERIAIHSLRPENKLGWYRGAIRDRHTWLARSYFAVKLPAPPRCRAGLVLALMAEGRSNSAIADRLVVSERAVEKHISNIFSKLGLPPSDSDHRRVLAVLAYLGS